MTIKKVLIINAHQLYEGFSTGKLNQTLVDVATKTFEELGCQVRTTHIEKGYDVAREIENHGREEPAGGCQYRWVQRPSGGPDEKLKARTADRCLTEANEWFSPLV